MKNYLKIVCINPESMIPVYRQLANAIVQGLQAGLIVKDDLLPSLHDFCIALDISKQSVEKAYNALKAEGIVAGVQGKRYYIINDKLPQC